MKTEYYGYKTSKGAACFHNLSNPSNDFIAGDPRYVFQIKGEVVSLLNEDGSESPNKYSPDSVRNHAAWTKFTGNPFAPAKTYKRAANGRFVGNKPAKGNVRPENVVTGRRYINTEHPDVKYMGVGKPARIAVIDAPRQEWMNGVFVCDYEHNPVFWHAFVELTEADE